MIRNVVLFSLVMLVSACSSSQLTASGDAQARERLACADIGIDPGSSSLGQCVGDLDQSVWDLASDSSR